MYAVSDQCQSVFISIKICIVVTDVIMMLLVSGPCVVITLFNEMTLSTE